MEEESDSEGWGEGYDDDDHSSGGFDDESDGEQGFDEGSDDDSDSNDLENLDLKRAESKQLSKDYPFHILAIDKVKGVIASKLLELREEFEYANLNDFIIWKAFRDHDFVTENAKSYL
jgi:hypothetical protein